MSTDPSAALEDFLSAVREHFAASAHRTSETDPRVEASYMALADAFEIYEDSLYTAYGEVTPFELFDDVEDDRDEDEDEDDYDGDSSDQDDYYDDEDAYDGDVEADDAGPASGGSASADDVSRRDPISDRGPR
ncbi:hypothetical protein [Brevibacterium jeotgali]|uniref:Primosomal protein n=1 Tax=Brevibacterium jeotgali TaxID=1262550 RepID=A0A2H1L254_9MICO|nr:hypothetical protein [Brevibacterium jeotgali]TWC02848.1 hypothetical protein FB108_1550 [Brevibacterium jeotgali]SMY10870.1 hypothetical protein BJEO58_00445 [Brevibacterium jeotgali]